MAISGNVAIVGTAVTKFGVLHDSGYLDLVAEAGFGAVADAGVDMADIDAAWLATSSLLEVGNNLNPALE